MYHIMKEFVTNKINARNYLNFDQLLSQNIDAKASKATETNPANNFEAPVTFLTHHDKPPNPLVEFPTYKDILTPQAVHPVGPEVLQFKAAAPNPAVEKQTPFPTK